MKQNKKEELEKSEKQLLQISEVHTNGERCASVMKFAKTADDLLKKYNRDCWVNTYEHPEVTFNVGTSPIIKDADCVFGHKIIVHWISVSLLELAEKDFMKLPAERGSSNVIAESLLTAIKHWQMSEWIYFCEMMRQSKLSERKGFMATSDLHSCIRQFDLIRQQERKKIEDAHRLSYEEKECCILNIIYDKFTDTFDVCDRTTAAKNNFVRCEILKPIIDWCNQQGIVIRKEMPEKDVRLIIYWYKYILDSHGFGKNSINFKYKEVI